MIENLEKKSSRGGFRPGAGRKKTTEKRYALYATQEVTDILERVKGSKSDFICRCILFYASSAPDVVKAIDDPIQ